MKQINTAYAYGIIGLLIGIIIGSTFSSFGNSYSEREYRNSASGNMMHRMSDGSMMNNGTAMGDNSMDSMMKGMMQGLAGKTGDAFDKEFLTEMIVHHQGAVQMANEVLKNSKRPELLELANNIISAQNKEIGMMQGWKAAWFK